jgi:Tol biopolymer transport system component
MLPTYTPDGRQLVFSRCILGDHCAVYSIRVDGTHLRALTRLRAVNDIQASVSPDGKQIAFTRLNANGIISQIYVMRANGSGAHAVTPPAFEGVGPHWSPTGKLITFTSNCCRPGSNVYVMHPDGTGIRRLTHTLFPHNSFLSAYAPAADRIVFASDRRYANFCCNDLFVMRSNGTQETLVHTGLTGVLSPSWGTAPLVKAASRAPAIPRPASSAGFRRADGTWCRALPTVLRTQEKCAYIPR